MAEQNSHVSAEARVALRRRFLSLPTLISFTAAILVLYFVLGGLGLDLNVFGRHIVLRGLELDLSSLGRLLRQSDPLLILLALVVYYATFPLRGLRWYFLLRYGSRSEGNISIPSYWRLGSLVLLGWFGNCISWVRLGDPYRAYLITEYSAVGFPRSMGTIVAERAFDVPIIFMLLLASVVAVWGTHPGSSVVSFIWVGFALISLLVLGLLAMRVFRGVFHQRLPGRLKQFYLRFEEGLLGGVRAMPMVIPITVVIWLIEATSLYLVTLAIGVHVTFAFAIFAYLGSSLLLSIPLTPGGLGIVEVGMTGLLSLKMSQEAALSTTLLVRAITFGTILVFGGILFATHQVRHRPAAHKETVPSVSAGD